MCVFKSLIFTCELIQAAARAATMQGHAGLGPAKGQKSARQVGAFQQLKTPLSLVYPGDFFFGGFQLTGLRAQLKPAYYQLRSVPG